MKKISKGLHLASYSKESSLGLTYSSKPGRNYGEEIDSEGSKNSVGYIQKFDNAPLDKNIKNSDLLIITKTRLTSDVLKAHLIYKISEKNTIIMNKNKNQLWVCKTKEDMLLANKFIKDHTKNDESLNDFLEFENYKKNIIFSGEKLLLRLSNASKEEKFDIFESNKHTYDSLKELSESKYTNTSYIKDIVLKIEEII